MKNLKKTEKKIHEVESQPSVPKHLIAEVDEGREMKIVELLDESETYLERNMNTAANSMSLMALHAVELSSYVQK